MDIEQEVPAIAQRCTTCSLLLTHDVLALACSGELLCVRVHTRAGNLYCRRCFTCRACARSLFDDFDNERTVVRYYELLDECYCHDCHLFYKQRLYALQHKGCGPPGRLALDAFMPKRVCAHECSCTPSTLQLADSATSIVIIEDV
jgi:hypothetical protein